MDGRGGKQGHSQSPDPRPPHLPALPPPSPPSPPPSFAATQEYDVLLGGAGFSSVRQLYADGLYVVAFAAHKAA